MCAIRLRSAGAARRHRAGRCAPSPGNSAGNLRDQDARDSTDGCSHGGGSPRPGLRTPRSPRRHGPLRAFALLMRHEFAQGRFSGLPSCRGSSRAAVCWARPSRRGAVRGAHGLTESGSMPCRRGHCDGRTFALRTRSRMAQPGQLWGFGPGSSKSEARLALRSGFSLCVDCVLCD